MPTRIARLPTDRGFPVPWFVAWIDGKPDFRVIGPGKTEEAYRRRRCWVCGDPLGRYVAYVVGPMCAVNRTSAEPPSHRDCAIYSARHCPFLSRPHMRRREDRVPEGVTEPGGQMIRRNPGVALVWVTTTVRRKREGLFDLGEPDHVLWYAEGREATREEVMASIESGLPLLREVAEEHGELDALAAHVDRAMPLVPAA